MDLDMLSPSDAQAQLRRLFPSHDVWFVPHYTGGNLWCAKPKTARTATIHAYSPVELAHDINLETADAYEPDPRD